jgi:hypothetical protein
VPLDRESRIPCGFQAAEAFFTASRCFEVAHSWFRTVLVLNEMVLVIVLVAASSSTSTANAEYEYEKPGEIAK